MTARSIAPNFIVVIRTAGERTFETCNSLVLKQVPASCLHIVNERPFEAALRRCYQIGIESNADWMVTLDADVLLREEAIQGLLSEATAMPSNHFQIEGRVFDKLTHRVRWAGYRCYRIQYLKEAVTCLPEHREQIRPEFTTLERMQAQGYPYLRSQAIYGIHDFEQSYADIYRKAFVHAEKHQVWLYEMLEHWKSQASSDHDFLVALRGAADSLTALQAPRIDQRDFQAGAERMLTDLGLQEKPNLSTLSIQTIESILASAQIATNSQPTSRWQRLADRYTRLGPWRFAPHLLGSALCDVGNAIKRLAEH